MTPSAFLQLASAGAEHLEDSQYRFEDIPELHGEDVGHTSQTGEHGRRSPTLSGVRLMTSTELSPACSPVRLMHPGLGIEPRPLSRRLRIAKRSFLMTFVRLLGPEVHGHAHL